MIRYDVQNDTYSEFVEYPKGFNPNCHGTAYIPHLEKLYFFCGYNRHFGILDLKSMEWDIKSTINSALTAPSNISHDDEVQCTKSKNPQNDLNVPSITKVSSAYLPAPIDEVHLFGFNSDCNTAQHLKWDESLHRFVVLAECGHLVRPKMVWISAHNMLMVMGGEDAVDTIYCCPIDYKLERYQWREYEATLPMAPSEYMELLVVFGSILVVFCPNIGPAFSEIEPLSERASIWCLDLQTKQWMKSAVNPPDDGHFHVMVGSDNCMHCIRFTADPKHYKISLMEIIPQQIRVRYLEKFLSVIRAYCHWTERTYGTATIPKEIVNLILKTYPIFG